MKTHRFLMNLVSFGLVLCSGLYSLKPNSCLPDCQNYPERKVDCYFTKAECHAAQGRTQVSAAQEPRNPIMALSIENVSGKFDFIRVSYIDNKGYPHDINAWLNEEFAIGFTKCIPFDSSVVKITQITIGSGLDVAKAYFQNGMPGVEDVVSRVEVGASKCDLGGLQSPIHSAIHFKVTNDGPGGKNRIWFADECRDCSHAQ